MTNPLNLSGTRILVTGASSGIGRETSILLSQLGAQLLLAGRDQERLRRTLSELEGEGHALEAFDLTDVEAIPGWLKAITAKTGELNGLVHSAGIHSFRPLRNLNAERFEAVQRINVSAALMLAKGLQQKSCCAAGGSIVFLSSVAGIVGEAGVGAYAASKAAVLGLTRSLALELAPEGFRVNSVAPGLVRTEMTETLLGRLGPEQIASIEAAYPLGLGTARDVAYGVAFLLSGAARWITGSTLIIDGGYTAH